MELNKEYTFDIEERIRYIPWIIFLILSVILGRLFYLQVLRASYYRSFAVRTSIKEVKIPAPRGDIYTRDGTPLVESSVAFDIVVTPQYISDKVALAETLGSLLHIDKDSILARLDEISKLPPYKSYPVVYNVGTDGVAIIKSRLGPVPTSSSYNLDGVDVAYRYVRNYPSGDVAPHLLGYVGIPTQERIAKMKEEGREYRMDDVVGIGGVEEMYDSYLRGEDGLEEKVVDALGREVGEAGVGIKSKKQDVKKGASIFLTIDYRLQLLAKDLFGSKRGALVAIDPLNGAVLAFYSSPGYDLALLTGEERSSYWQSLLADEGNPLFNRVISGTYSPGSTFKLISAAAALESGVVTKDRKIHCGGGIQFGNRFFGCWLRSGHGSLDVVDAISESCDTFFYNVGLELGIDRLAYYARLFGLGAKTGIDLPGEASGIMPDPKWKLETKKKEWSVGDILSAVIGQGYVTTTPLQVAVMAAVIANGGFRVTPYVVDKLVSPDGSEIYKHKPKIEKLPISDDVIELVKQGMIAAIESPKGTAHALTGYGLKIAGKTGTTQVVGRESKKHKEPHAWFVGFAPYDNPSILVAVIVEHGGHGSSGAAPIAAKVMKEYFYGKRED